MDEREHKVKLIMFVGERLKLLWPISSTPDLQSPDDAADILREAWYDALKGLTGVQLRDGMIAASQSDQHATFCPSSTQLLRFCLGMPSPLEVAGRIETAITMFGANGADPRHGKTEDLYNFLGPVGTSIVNRCGGFAIVANGVSKDSMMHGAKKRWTQMCDDEIAHMCESGTQYAALPPAPEALAIEGPPSPPPPVAKPPVSALPGLRGFIDELKCGG